MKLTLENETLIWAEKLNSLDPNPTLAFEISDLDRAEHSDLESLFEGRELRDCKIFKKREVHLDVLISIQNF